MQAEEQPPSRANKSALREAVETVVATVLIYFLVHTFLIENYRVEGRSMVPTLADNQFLMVSKLSYRLGEPQRGDIVVFRDPHGGKKRLIKRVIGLPGELVEIRNGQVFVNDRLLAEPYIAAPASYSSAAQLVPEAQYFVLGDNRSNSSDSHNWGTLPRDKLVGKAWVSYWPPELWGVIAHEIYGDTH